MPTKERVLAELVKEEAKLIREHATKKQISNLSFFRLNGRSPQNCIYGQMTGNCFSKEATKLIHLCAPRVYKGDDMDDLDSLILNGKLDKKANRQNANDLHWSPIEIFIYGVNSKAENSKRLIAYLKGETDNLRFVKK